MLSYMNIANLSFGNNMEMIFFIVLENIIILLWVKICLVFVFL